MQTAPLCVGVLRVRQIQYKMVLTKEEEAIKAMSVRDWILIITESFNFGIFC